MSTGSGSSSHSRFGSSSSTSSINSLSDTHHSSLYPEYRPNSYPSSSLHMERPNSNINLQTSLDFEMPDNMGRNDRMLANYSDHHDSIQSSRTHQQPNYLDQLQQLQNQNRQLQDQNLILCAQYSTLQQNYNSLLDKISTSSPHSSSASALYVQVVQFFERREYSIHVGCLFCVNTVNDESRQPMFPENPLQRRDNEDRNLPATGM
ncbi:hypothetical protein B0H14DRAFT_2633004 [Mycena olivaceomarginata]|nr:hypothetical protein B0H14DRAFT_2633004 [Mycena olivaceomarginata]